jgi:alcohol dehydrogenase (cytochrome c)
MKSLKCISCGLILLTLFSSNSSRSLAQSVTYDDILHSSAHPENWITYGGNYSSHRFSDLKQIDTKNVGSLKMQWVYQLRKTGINETSPIVVGGMMYITEPPTTVTALDARTGKAIWRWTADLPKGLLTIGLFPTNRGVAILGDTVYVATIDSYLVALDAKTGAVRWRTHIAENKEGYATTHAPLAINGKIIVGTGGGEAGLRGLLDAYDARTGKRLWRIWTVPAAGEPGVESWSGDSWKRGGGTTWNAGSYDPESNTLYWGTGNPAPNYNGEGRLGDNLYSCSVLAIGADTGKMKWYFQFSPHELHDWDSAEPPVLFDAMLNGKPRKLVALANRNAFYYVLDRVTGEFLVGVPFAKQTWAKGLTAKGRPILEDNIEPLAQGTLVYPAITGAVNWSSPSYSPLTGLFYVNTREMGAYYFKGHPTIEPANPADAAGGGGQRTLAGDDAYNAIRALEATTGKLKWQFKMSGGDTWTGVLSTAGGLVFSADGAGNFFALDAETGRPLWNFNFGAMARANPVTYAVDGKQYVAVSAGNSMFVFALP